MICRDCKEEKGQDFYRDKQKKKGFLPYCKPCYEMRRKVRINPATERARVSRWYKKTGYASLRNMRSRYPEKYKARWLLQYAVRSGKVIKPTVCDVCHSLARIDGHQ